MKRNWIEAIIHIIFWGSTAWLIASNFSIQSQEIEISNNIETINIVRSNGLIYQILFCIVVAIVMFYINVWIIYKLNKTINNNRSFWYSLLNLVVAIVVVYTTINLNYLFDVIPLPTEMAFGIIIFYFAISIAYGLTKLRLYSNQRQQQLVLDKKQAELTLLRNQLQPHFLFNALNNLLSMAIPTGNTKLINSFEQLSQLLRYVIEESKTEKVSISKEIDFIKNYIELQLLRFNENEVDVQLNIQGQYDSQKIEPGLFISFVENAFKYGTEPEKATTIEINFDLSNLHSVNFQVKNKVMLKNINGIGTGIEITQKRLNLIYPNKHQLSINNSDYFSVDLNLITI